MLLPHTVIRQTYVSVHSHHRGTRCRGDTFSSLEFVILALAIVFF